MITAGGSATPSSRRRRQRAGSAARRSRRRAVTARAALLALVGATLTVSALWPAARIELPAPAAAASPADTVRPVPGEVAAGFDPPEQPYGPGRRGVRLVAAPGDAVRTARGGDVVFAGPVAGTPWVSVDHGGGLRTSYGPVEPSVRVGEQVAAGDVLGRLADDDGGLHWGARIEGTYIDPLDLLRSWRPVLVPRGEQPE